MSFMQFCEKLGERIVAAHAIINGRKQRLITSLTSLVKKQNINDIFSFVWSVLYASAAFFTVFHYVAKYEYIPFLLMFIPAFMGIVSAVFIIIKKVDIRRLFFHRVGLAVLNIFIFYKLAYDVEASWLFTLSAIIVIDIVCISLCAKKFSEGLVIFLTDPFHYYFFYITSIFYYSPAPFYELIID